MRLTQGIRGLLVALVSFGLTLTPTASRAAEGLAAEGQTASRTLRVINAGSVVLGQTGALQGSLVSAGGQAVTGAPVALVKGFEVVAQTHTDTQGRFQIQGLDGGEYLLMTADGVYRYQLFPADQAPSDAKQTALLVVDGQLARGSLRDRGLLGPDGLGGVGTWCVIGAAVAVGTVIAVAEDDDAS